MAVQAKDRKADCVALAALPKENESKGTPAVFNASAASTSTVEVVLTGDMAEPDNNKTTD